MVTGVFQDVNGQQTHTQFFVGLTIATALVAMVPLIIIFLYGNRKLQIALSYGAMLVIMVYSFWMEQSTKKIMGDIQIDTHNWGIGLFLTSISILFIVFGIKAIQRDE